MPISPLARSQIHIPDLKLKGRSEETWTVTPDQPSPWSSCEDTAAIILYIGSCDAFDKDFGML